MHALPRTTNSISALARGMLYTWHEHNDHDAEHEVQQPTQAHQPECPSHVSHGGSRFEDERPATAVSVACSGPVESRHNGLNVSDVKTWRGAPCGEGSPHHKLHVGLKHAPQTSTLPSLYFPHHLYERTKLC